MKCSVEIELSIIIDRFIYWCLMGVDIYFLDIFYI